MTLRIVKTDNVVVEVSPFEKKDFEFLCLLINGVEEGKFAILESANLIFDPRRIAVITLKDE